MTTEQAELDQWVTEIEKLLANPPIPARSVVLNHGAILITKSEPKLGDFSHALKLRTVYAVKESGK